MPDLDQFVQQIRAEVSTLHWPPPEDIRARGSRRRHIATTAAISFVVVAIVVVVTVLPLGGSRRGVPAATHATSAQPSSSRSLEPPATVRPATVPAAALLSATDFGAGFTRLGAPFPRAAAPNPFLGCGPDGLPAALPIAASLGAGFGQGQDGTEASESILRYAGGRAHQTMAAIRALVAGACTGKYQILGQNLGGDESLLLRSTDPAVIAPEAAHGTALYYAVVRRGDYLLWITLVNQAPRPNQASLVTTVADRAQSRLCTAVTC